MKKLLLLALVPLLGVGCSSQDINDNFEMLDKQNNRLEQRLNRFESNYNREIKNIDKRLTDLEAEQLKISSTTKELSDEIFISEDTIYADTQI